MGWLLLAGALGLLWIALRVRRATGIPWSRITSSDTSSWRRTDEPLVSQRYGLVGKPDYVIATRHGLIPIEVKPSRTAPVPYESDLMQLAAYCLLVEDTTGRAPRYGLLRYASQTFQLRYTDSVRADVLTLLDMMRDDRAADDVPRSHDQPARCRACGLRHACDDRLS